MVLWSSERAFSQACAMYGPVSKSNLLRFIKEITSQCWHYYPSDLLRKNHGFHHAYIHQMRKVIEAEDAGMRGEDTAKRRGPAADLDRVGWSSFYFVCWVLNMTDFCFLHLTQAL